MAVAESAVLGVEPVWEGAQEGVGGRELGTHYWETSLGCNIHPTLSRLCFWETQRWTLNTEGISKQAKKIRVEVSKGRAV
jgi:hypothetical protein